MKLSALYPEIRSIDVKLKKALTEWKLFLKETPEKDILTLSEEALAKHGFSTDPELDKIVEGSGLLAMAVLHLEKGILILRDHAEYAQKSIQTMLHVNVHELLHCFQIKNNAYPHIDGIIAFKEVESCLARTLKPFKKETLPEIKRKLKSLLRNRDLRAEIDRVFSAKTEAELLNIYEYCKIEKNTVRNNVKQTGRPDDDLLNKNNEITLLLCSHIQARCRQILTARKINVPKAVSFKDLT